jgi:hypothetical protein
MSWAVGFDPDRNRFIGYGVPAYCDHPGCNVTIDRGISHTCGDYPGGGEHGCGLHFCGEHLHRYPQVCSACANEQKAFPPSQEHPTWSHHLLTDETWADWRAENAETVRQLFDLLLQQATINGAGRLAAAGHELSHASIDVLAERRRQVEVKGWDHEHDDAQKCDEIAAFAAVYAMPEAARDWPAKETGYGATFAEALLPFAWEPKFGDRRRDLVKAAALLVAEIERLDRAASNIKTSGAA